MTIEILQAQIDALEERIKELERRVPQTQSGIPWYAAPDWAQWAAMDASGEWYWYEEEPRLDKICWATPSTPFTIFFGPPVADWRQSKQSRP